MPIRLLLSIFCFYSVTGMSLGIFTNGGGFSADSDNVWFLGEEPVRYCVRSHPQFSFSESEVRDVIRQSIQTWVDFLERYGLDKMEFSQLHDHSSLGLALKFIEVESCDDPSVELTFLMDPRPLPLADASGVRYRDIGYAMRGSYNHMTYRNTGTIHIMNWLKNTRELKHLITHELGHVFGMAHGSLPIMHEYVADVFNAPTEDNSLLGMIELPTWRYRLRAKERLDFTYTGTFNGMYESNQKLGPLREIFGFNAGGHHSLNLRLSSNDTQGDMSLVAVDQSTGRRAEMPGRFELRAAMGDPWTGESGPVLFSYWRPDFCSHVLTGARHLDTRALNTQIEGVFEFNGKSYPMVLQGEPHIVLRIFNPDTGRWWNTESYKAEISPPAR